jgi:ribosomal protein L37E
VPDLPNTDPERPDVGPVPPRLDARERRRALLAALATLVLVAVLILPFVLLGTLTWTDLVGGTIVYGGLLGLTVGVVAVDRQHARQCRRCTARNARGTETCAACGYDLANEPRWACDQGHGVHLEPGLCHCGRRLLALPPARGVGREVVVMLKVGAWLLAFLLGVGVLLQVTS